MATRVAAPPAPHRRLDAPETSSTAGLLPVSLLATCSLLVLPGATVALAARMAGTAFDGPAGWALTLAVSLTYMFVGAKLWARHPRSAELTWGELVLWSWARRRRAESTLERSAALLDYEIPSFLDPQSRREQIEVLHELNAALEVRDPYTRGHARRVERHAHRIALALRCSDDDIFDIRLAASLHDVGKIKVPDRILRKDGPLEDDEWAVMKQHSEVGADLLERLGNHKVVAAVRSHHERWDGRGYPDGLSGTRIPLSARIIAVADTFDAITSCRPYRNRSSRVAAIEVLKSEAGKQFDPAVVSAFLSATPHKAVALAGAAALVAPVARKLASQWGVVLNKAGAVSLAGTMTASAFTGVAAVERPLAKKLDGREKPAAVEQAEDQPVADDTAAAGGESGSAPSPRGNAYGHDKKAHAGGNGKSHAGGNGKSQAPSAKPEKPEKPGEPVEPAEPEEPAKAEKSAKPEKAEKPENVAGGPAKEDKAPAVKAEDKAKPDTAPEPAPPPQSDEPAEPAAPAEAPAPAPPPPPAKDNDKAKGKSK